MDALDTKTQDDAAKSGNRGSWLAALAIAFMVGYPLSVGPMIWVGNRLPHDAQYFIWMPYAPLLFLVEQAPVIEPIAEKYAMFWHEL